MPDHDHETDEQLGPIDFLAVEFPDGHPSSAGFELLLDLAERDVIRILDVEFVAKGADGVARAVPVEEVAGAELSAWQGASSALLDVDDLARVGADMAAGGVAVVVVFENRWVTGLIDAWRSAGARLIAEGGIPAEDLVAALDATDAR